jgi:hypothetical protein
MNKQQEIEILISADGETMEVRAHGFQGKGCEALVNAFRFGQVTESGRTAEYYKQATADKHLTQGE